MSENYYNYVEDYGYTQPSGYESRNSQLEAQGVDTDIGLIYGKGFQPSSTTPGGNCDTTGLERIARFYATADSAKESEEGIDVPFQENISSIQKIYKVYDAGSGMMHKLYQVEITIDPKITILRYKTQNSYQATELVIVPKSDSPYVETFTILDVPK